MKITKIETILAGTRHLFVRVHTDEGITGLGESALWGAREGVIGTLRLLEQPLIGADASRMNFINEQLYMKHQFKGMNIMSAISAIDLALWDIKGKALGQPVYQLIGGKYRDRIRVWEPIMGHSDLGEICALAQKAKDEGYTAIRITPTAGTHDMPTVKRLKTMYDRVAAVREVAGDDIDIGIEIHRDLNPDDAVRFCNMLDGLDIMFFEDPHRSENIETMAYMCSKTTTPIAAGERCISIQEFEMLLNAGMRLVRPDICTLQGLTGNLKVAALAEAHHAGVIPHVPCGAVNMTAAAHYSAAIPNFTIMEKFGEKTFAEVMKEFRDDCRPVIKDGCLELPEGPGWGIELAEDLEERVPYTVAPWSLDARKAGLKELLKTKE